MNGRRLLKAIGMFIATLSFLFCGVFVVGFWVFGPALIFRGPHGDPPMWTFMWAVAWLFGMSIALCVRSIYKDLESDAE